MSLNNSNWKEIEEKTKKIKSLKYLNFDESGKFNLSWKCLNWVSKCAFSTDYSFVIENWFITKDWIVNIFSWEIFILSKYWWIISDKNWFLKKDQCWAFIESFEVEKARTISINKDRVLPSYDFELEDGSTLRFSFMDIEIWNKSIVFEYWTIKLYIDKKNLVKEVFKNKKIIILIDLIKKCINSLIKFQK